MPFEHLAESMATRQRNEKKKKKEEADIWCISHQQKVKRFIFTIPTPHLT
jgi:hypothetical protein